MPMIGNIDFGVDGSDGQEASSGMAPLPLNLLALIISYLDEPADLARACRTCRILHYMCLPALYSNVSLPSYDYIRRSEIDNRPEGSGGSSPFSMGLNALMTRSVAGYVKKFRVFGKWKEYDLEEYSKMGRVPDNSMMLNMAIRAAVDRMSALETFTWDLNTKMLPTVWLGLVQKQTLTSLTVRFPTLRIPRPSLMVPPIPNLRSLHIIDIDPVCYPDNISLLLLGSKKLETLKLHWNPRMREAREPSVNLHSYFGKMSAANYMMPLKHIAFQNLFAYNEETYHSILNNVTIESCTLISSLGGADDSPEMVFVEKSWDCSHIKPQWPSLRMLRNDKVSKILCQMLTVFTTLERYYLITGRKLVEPPFEQGENSAGRITNIETNGRTGYLEKGKENGCNFGECYGFYGSSGITPNSGNSPQSTMSNKSVPETHRTIVSFTPPAETTAISRLGNDYLDAIMTFHGANLRHLLLLPQWRLSAYNLAGLVRNCPNLEQLGLGTETSNYQMLRLLLPFLSKLYAIRLLDNVDDSAVTEHCTMLGDSRHEAAFCDELWKPEYEKLRWIGLGDRVFKVYKGKYAVKAGEEGLVKYRRKVKRVPLEAVKDVEIWSMDTLAI